MPRLRVISAILFIMTLLICPASETLAAETVEVVVEGVTGDALQNVREALALPYGLVREGKVDRLWLERFTHQASEKARTALEPFGYYNARVAITTGVAGEGGYRLQVKVDAGEPVRLAEVKVVLNGPGSREAQLKEQVASFPLAKGGVLLQQNYERAKEALKSLAQQMGYLDADFSTHEIRIDKGASSARIELVLETGERYYFAAARIEGAPDYPETFLHRYLAFKTGDVFSYARLGETQLNLTNSERFRDVLVTPEKQEAVEHKVPVVVQLKPAPRWSLRPGIGYGTDTGARFSTRYRDLNMFHLGHELFANLYIAERLQGLATGYVLPSSIDIKSSTTLQLNLQREELEAYVSRLIAVEVARNHSFSAGRLGTAYLKLQQEEFTVGAQNSSTRLVLPGLRFTENRYDNLIRPSRGYRYTVEVRGTSRIVGSDTGLLQAIAEGSHLQPLPWRLSLQARAKAGITLLSDPLRDFPPTLRFFAGGDQSVRGYAYKTLGPRDASGQVVGGKQLLSGSVELERALFKNWGVSIFYDAGNAFDSFSGITLFQGAGVGLHYYSPVGALNLSLARQVGVESPSYHVHFTVGFEL